MLHVITLAYAAASPYVGGGGGAYNSNAYNGMGAGTAAYDQGYTLRNGEDIRPRGDNPFAVHPQYYVNHDYQSRVLKSMRTAWAASAHTHEEMNNMLSVPSAFWVDRIAKVRASTAGGGASLEGLLRDAASQASPPLVVVILYDLPNRDCHALASNGEICCEYLTDGTCNYESLDGSCNVGLRKYKSEYVDPFVQTLATYRSVPVVVIMEPDSLPNLATNLATPRCGNQATQTAYADGIAYALEALHQSAPHAVLYLDAGHGGWLGWPEQADKFAAAVRNLRGGTYRYLRGFATNVANYQTLGEPCPSEAFGNLESSPLSQYCLQSGLTGHGCCADPCNLLPEFNAANNEHNYVQMLNARMTAAIPDFSPRFIIDTGRNGVSGAIRQSCANWCNIRGAGLGRKPTSRTDLPDIVDAYFWLKTPGESDGCTEHLPDGSRCPRFDAMCASVDSIGSAAGEPRAPEAGDWFIPQLAELSCHGAIEGKDSGFTSECQSKLRVAAQEEGLTLSTTSSIAVDTPRSKDATMTVGERQQRTAVIPLNDPRWQQDSAYGPAIRPDSGTGYSPGGGGSWQPRQSTVESTGGSSHVVLGLSLLGLALFGFLRHGGHYWKPHARERLGDERFEELTQQYEQHSARLSEQYEQHIGPHAASLSAAASRIASQGRRALARKLISIGHAAGGDELVATTENAGAAGRPTSHHIPRKAGEDDDSVEEDVDVEGGDEDGDEDGDEEAAGLSFGKQRRRRGPRRRQQQQQVKQPLLEDTEDAAGSIGPLATSLASPALSAAEGTGGGGEEGEDGHAEGRGGGATSTLSSTLASRPQRGGPPPRAASKTASKDSAEPRAASSKPTTHEPTPATMVIVMDEECDSDDNEKPSHSSPPSLQTRATPGGTLGASAMALAQEVIPFDDGESGEWV